MSNVSEVGSDAWCRWHPWVGRRSSFHLIALLRDLFQCEMCLTGLSGELTKSLCERYRREIPALPKKRGIVQQQLLKESEAGVRGIQP